MDNETATTEESHTPVSLVKTKPTISQDLGRVAAVGASVVGEGARNNTRWVFDLLAQAGSSVLVQLLEHQSGRSLNPDKLSLNVCPTSAEAWLAKPYVTHLVTDDGTFALHSEKVVDEHGEPVTFSVRVSVDTIHTSIR